jgi:hyperosmotically inducible periplasmic protein
MLKKLNVAVMAIAVIATLLFTATTGVAAAQQNKTQVQLGSPKTRDINRMEVLQEEVRHQLVMLPYYSVFDWLQAEVKSDGAVVLTGEVTRPTLKSDAEDRVKKLEGATRIIDNIEVLPLSPMDDELRVALYRALFRFNGPLFRYGTQSVPPIHIIVKNGHVALKGIVLNQMDSQLAEMAALGVPGSFEVRNELQIEQQLDEKVSRR